MKYKTVNKFKIGCDPEFGLQRNDGLIAGSLHGIVAFSRPPRGVGQDCGCLVELRPTPSYSAYVLCKRLRKLITSAKLCNEKALAYKFRAGAYANLRTHEECDCDECVRVGNFDPPQDCYTLRPITFGGHIHFDARQCLSWQQHAVGAVGAFQDESELPVAKALTNLTRTLEVLDILPSEECSRRRNDGGYGQPGDVRHEGRTFEFREMCSWLFSPEASLMALTLAKLVALDPDAARTAFEKPASYKDTSNFVARFASADDDARLLSEVVLSKGHAALKARPDENFLPKWRNWSLEMSPRRRGNRLML